MCNHCENPACVAAAKDGAVYQREDGLVQAVALLFL